MHTANRPARNRVGTHHRRGFSLIETIAAVSLLLIVAAGVTAVLSAGLGTQTRTTQARMARDAMVTLTERLASVPPADLVAGTFTVPEPCPDTATGPAGRSCLSVGGQSFEVDWQVGLDDIVAGDGGTDIIRLVAHTGFAAGVTVTRTVAAPTVGFLDGFGLARVALIDGAVDDATPVYLLDAATPRNLVASGVFYDNVALLRVDGTACTATARCVVSFSPVTVGAVTGNVFLTGPAAIVGLAVPAAATVPAVAAVATQSNLTVDLLAQAASGQNAAPNVAGSVCVWVSFDDAGGRRQVPLCNTDDPSRVTFDAYTATRSGEDFPLAAGTTVTFTTDRASGGCPSVTGAKAFSAGSWVTGAVCTSWTWGRAGTLTTADAAVTFDGAAVYVDGSTVTATWSSSPAAGYSGDPLWAKPRDAVAGCHTNASCTPAPASAPEPDTCPGLHCYSSALTAPLLVSSYYPAAPSTVALIATETTFTLTVHTPDSDQGTFTVLSIGSGTLEQVVRGVDENNEPTVSYQSVTAGTVLAAGATEGQQLELRYTRPANHTLTNVSVAVAGDGGGTRTQVLRLATGNPVVSLRTRPGTAAQAGSGTVAVSARRADGTVASGATVSVTGPAGFSSNGATLDGAGRASVTVNVGDVAAGVASLTASTGPVSSTVAFTVTATAGAVNLTGTANIAQGGTDQVTVTATDRAGDALTNTLVSLRATRSGAVAQGVTITPAACRTNAGGACTLTVAVSPGAARGPLTLTAAAGSATDTATIEVTGTIARLSGPAATRLAPGASTTLTFTATDGAGRAVAGPVAFTYATGITGPATASADTDGIVTVTVTAGAQAAQGARVVTATAGSSSAAARVVVDGVAATVTTSGAVVNGRTGQLTVAVFDADGAAVAGVTVTVSGGTLAVPATVTTGSDGTAVVWFSGPSAGSYVLSFTATGTAGATRGVTLS